MEYTFEFEYDGVYYQIEAEYAIERDGQDHAFGCRAVESVLPVKWVAFVDGVHVSVVDEKLKKAIWNECDSYSDKAYANSMYYIGV